MSLHADFCLYSPICEEFLHSLWQFSLLGIYKLFSILSLNVIIKFFLQGDASSDNENRGEELIMVSKTEPVKPARGEELLIGCAKKPGRPAQVGQECKPLANDMDLMKRNSLILTVKESTLNPDALLFSPANQPDGEVLIIESKRESARPALV